MNYFRIITLFIAPLVVFVSASFAQQAVLSDLPNKPTSKNIVALNSEKKDTWTLWFGPQDKNAPITPTELLKSEFKRINASVPGNVEIDLQNAGLIDDPMLGDHIYDLRKYEPYTWWYQREFNMPDFSEENKVEIVFGGIDAIADIWLNGKLIAKTDNMLVEHHFDITELLQDKNELLVHIYSTVLESRKYMRNNFGVRSDALAEGVSIRKAPHMFGWDIMPRLISAGLWRDVKLEIIPATYWKSVYWVTQSVNVQDNTARIYVDWDFYTDRLNIDDLTLQIQLKRKNILVYERKIPVYTTVSRETISDLNNVEFWWPRSFGDPALYEASLKIVDSTGSVLCENKQNIGIRKSELIRSEINTEENPGEFVFKVNGEKVFVKGTNWVPLDGLHSRDLQHLSEAVDMLVDLNCNMVRLWGGNVYENDEFYDLCDKNGIMVWQDFVMGCTIYPQDNEFASTIREEAIKVILRLRNHPSLVLWAGNNENDVSLNWSGQGNIDPNLDVISRQVLPLALREFDPNSSYIPSSPFISTGAFAVEGKVNDAYSPEMHLWGPRGYYKAAFYTKNRAKFVSEIGYHGCPNVESLERMMEKDYVYPWVNDQFEWNKQWQAKATISNPNSNVNRSRNNLMINQVKAVFGEVPTDLEQFSQASQIVQAEAMKYFIEFWRMNKFERNGILWWNLRDGWPIISDAVVDYYGGKKLAYGYIKKVQTDVCVMISDATENFHSVIAVNDTRSKVKCSVKISDADTKQIILQKEIAIESNGKVQLEMIPSIDENKLWLIEWELDGKKFKNHYMAYHPPMDLTQYIGWLTLIQ